MGMHIIRYKFREEIYFGVLDGETILELSVDSSNLQDLLDVGVKEAKELLESGTNEKLFLSQVEVLSPIPTPSQIICQGVNYSLHRQETGMKATRPAYNMIFSKAPSSICSATHPIVRPDHVKLLDYEVELGLVVGKEMDEQTTITEENFHEYIAGLVIGNDISARDVQLTELQWLKGKSYRTFCPVGPYLYLIEKDDVPKLNDLELVLKVNGEIRQQANTDQLLFKPIETFNELTKVMDFQVGDLVLTGTPGGVAMQLSPEEMNCMTSLVSSYEEKVEVINRQSEVGNYLKDGDVLETTIYSKDGSIHLGTQHNVVKSLQSISI